MYIKEFKKYIGKYYQHREQLTLLRVSGFSSTDWDDFENSSYDTGALKLELLFGAEKLLPKERGAEGILTLSLEELTRDYVPVAEVKTRDNLPSSRATEPTFILIKDENRPVVNPNRRYWWSIPAWKKQEAMGIGQKFGSKKAKKSKAPVGDSWETRVSNIVDDTEF